MTKAPKRRKIPRKLLFAIAIPIIAWLLGWYALPFLYQIPESLTEKPAASPVLSDRHGKTIAHLTFDDFTRSAPVSLAEIPQTLIDATLAAEDKRFHQHGGIDLVATLRAAWDLARKREVVSGASTITQQLVKISSPPAKRNLPTKFRETMIARRLEMKFGKQEILERYLARLDYGNLRISPTEAARFYFQKPLTDLSLAESALLAGLPQGPSWLNPLRHPQRATTRRNLVLDRLEKNLNYPPERIALAKSETLQLRPIREIRTAPWLNRPADASTRTTLDADLQQEAERIVSEETAKLKHANLRHAAVVVIHNPSGEILAMVSSADWNDPRGGKIHGALAPRSPGSALKPFTYILSFRHLGKLPSSILADIPTPLRTEQGLKVPENYDRTYRGPVTLRHALACSLNIPAMREVDAHGGPQLLHHFLRDLGLSTLRDNPTEYGVGLTLGNAPVRLIELANAYATIARGGKFLPMRLFLDDSPTPEAERIFEADSAILISDILSDPIARAPSFPPGGPLDLPFRAAVKTGTSSDFRDNWCIGYTPEFTVAVWAGNFEHQPMQNISGVAGAGPIYQRLMLRLHAENPPTSPPHPDPWKRVIIDPRNGKKPPTQPLASNIPNQTFILPPNHQTPQATAADYDPQGRAKIPSEYHDWFHSTHNLRRHELVLDTTPDTRPLRITRPQNNTTVWLDPEIPGSNKLLPLVSNLPQQTLWSSPTLTIENHSAQLTEGSHQIIATDQRDGSTRDITIHVKTL